MPPPGRATLDLGCGEGRVARELTTLGHSVTAADYAPSLVEAAQQAASARDYVVADAGALPFGDGVFDQIVAYNVLMDVPDMPDYMAAFASAGLAITALREPVPDVDQVPTMAPWKRLPLFLWVNLSLR